LISCVAASLVLAGAAEATPATPTIAVAQTAALKMRLTSSTGTHWAWKVLNASAAVVATGAVNPLAVTLTAPGNYTAQLDATDDNAAAPAPAHAQASFHVYDKPVARFGNAQLADGTVQVTDTSTGEPTTWTWTFPGGTSKVQAPPPQALPAGTSTVTLKVTNPAGNSSVSVPIVVNGPPVPVLSVLSSPAAINSAVLLDASRSTDPNKDALTFSWDLDGNGTFGDATGALQSVSYATPGTYRVAVQVNDGHGGIRTAEAAIVVVADKAPVVAFTNSPVEPVVGSTVAFTATASDADGTVVRIEWDLDDDGQFNDAGGTTATWSYTTPGPHRVAVRAVDDRGVASVAFRTIEVVSPALPNPTDQLQAASTGSSPTSSAPGPAIPNGPAPSSTRAPLLSPFPVVHIRGLLYRGAVRISLLRVQAPQGSTIRVRCRKGSCAAKTADVRVKAARAPVRVRSIEQRPLRAGTVVEVFVTAPRRTGKYTRFTVRRDGTPDRTDLCLSPGRTTPTVCPTT
jgi:PKD repeat protein